MSDEREPTKIHIGTFSEGLPNILFVPAGALKPATDVLDRERRAREMEAAKAKAAVLGRARNQGRLRRAMHAVFRGLGR
jgi:hypothetical protein